MSFQRLFQAFSIVFLAGLALLPAMSAMARQPVVSNFSSNYQSAFASIESGQCGPAESMVSHGADPVLNMVLRGLLMAQPGNNYSFDDLAGFVTDHPDWPGLNGILMIAEQKIPSGASADQIANWFSAHPALTLAGFYRQIEALNELGQDAKAAGLVRDRWINRDFSNDEFSAFQARFGHVLTAQDHRARLDHLLWDNNITGARAMFPLVGTNTKAMAEARLALSNQLNNAESYLARVPSHYHNDPGLLYERLRWRRKNNLDDSAIEILEQAPGQLGRPDNWWDERNIMIRRVMERRDYRLAYKLAADHGLQSGFDFIQAEFLAGWLALRFLNRPDRAHDHFKALLNAAATPISRARGAYWLGRSLEELGDKAAAEQAYETAAALNTTYYGQLALARLYANPVIRSDPEPAIPANVRSAFFARDSVKAIEHLTRIGQKDLARGFFKSVSDYSNQRFEFVLLMELAYELQRPDWAINASKAAAQKNMLVGAGSFPVLSMHIPTPPELAFTHALIRQESLFNADAGSSAGARGLMQLMPGTAKGICRKLDIRYSDSRLTDPDFNVRLGTAFVQQQLDQFDGSIILALAAYNAGPRRAREWIEQFGDPRRSRVDPIDWVEMMPIYETRNYVQRIIENLQFYRARLNGGQAPLTIVRDLKR
jgi:soluble lytic murein transglycosylase